jgi:hypothetical protein
LCSDDQFFIKIKLNLDSNLGNRVTSQEVYAKVKLYEVCQDMPNPDEDLPKGIPITGTYVYIGFCVILEALLH